MTVVRAASPKLGIEHVVEGDLACLRFAGTIDEQFAGAAVGNSVAPDTGALVLDLGGVRKISSFGIREWVDFLTAARTRAREVILVECAPKVVDQLNMVANFAAGARVYSLYAPFRCDFCDSEHRVLLQADRDADTITAMTLPERPCPACKQAMYFDDDGATFFSYIAAQPRAALSPAVAAFLGSRLDYALADGTRKLRADKVVDGRATYLRLSGDLDRAFPGPKLAEGLEGELFVDVAGIVKIDPAGAAEWRAFVQLVTPQIERLWLAGASAAFRDKLASAGDLGPRGAPLEGAAVQARYDALRAKATASRPSTAKLALAAIAASPHAPPPLAPASAARRTPLWVPVSAALIALGLAGGGVALYKLASTGGAATGPGLGAVDQSSATPRPAWASESASCAPTAGSLTCTAVSAPSARQDEAEDEAAEIAYDALAAALAVRIADKPWRAQVLPVFSATRDAKLAAFDRDPTNTVARREVREARHAVAQLVHTTGGASAPAVPTARYWERHTGADGARFVAYAQVVVPAADLTRLVDLYTGGETALGATAVKVFPGLGWRYPHVERGAVITALAPGPLQEIGLAEGYVVLAVNGRDVTDATAFAKLVTDEQAAAVAHGGTLRLKVAAGDGAPREFTRAYEAPTGPAVIPAPVTQPVHDVPTGGINVWDRYGGGTAPHK